MKIQFDTPEHGWIRMHLNKFELSVSDVPSDSLLMLTRVLGRLLSGSSSEEVEWSLEPEYAKWIFSRKGDELKLQLKTYSKAKPVYVYKAHFEVLIDCIIAALEDLSNDPCWIKDADELVKSSSGVVT